MKTNMHDYALDILTTIIRKNGMAIFNNKQLLITELTRNKASYDGLLVLIKYSKPDITTELCNSWCLNPNSWDIKVLQLKENLNGNRDKDSLELWIDVLAEAIRLETGKLAKAGPKNPNSKVFNAPPTDIPMPSVKVQNQAEGTDDNQTNSDNSNSNSNSNSNYTNNNAQKVIPISEDIAIIDTSSSAQSDFDIDNCDYTKEQLNQKLTEINDVLNNLNIEKMKLIQKETQLKENLQEYENQIVAREDKAFSKRDQKTNSNTVDRLKERNAELEDKLEKLKEAEAEFSKYNAEYKKNKDKADEYEEKLKKYS